MQNLYNRAFGSIFSGFIIFFVLACAGEPVKIDLPQNHPANPEAQESAFILLPNPFQGHMQKEIGGSPPSTQKRHLPSNEYQMTHEMDQMDKDSMSAPEPGVEKDDHQHEEHKQ
ncbi:MAG: hypothetical protein PVF56_01900 [Desulfobacterales bacterium]|jgi:hypothetical protein